MVRSWYSPLSLGRIDKLSKIKTAAAELSKVAQIAAAMLEWNFGLKLDSRFFAHVVAAPHNNTSGGDAHMTTTASAPPPFKFYFIFI